MRFRKNAMQVVNDCVDDRMWKPPRHERMHLALKRRTQFGVCKQQLNDALNLIAESFTKSRYIRFITRRIFENLQLRFRMDS